MVFFASCHQKKNIEETENTSLQYCQNLSQSLVEKDVIGEWLAKYGAGIDRLIIRENHTYKQIYSNNVTDIFIETDWHEWQIKYDNKVAYLKLNNMHKCDHFESICLLENGGGGDRHWGDYCNGNLIILDDGVILILLRVEPGDIYYGLTDVKMCHFSSDPDSGSYCFRKLK